MTGASIPTTISTREKGQAKDLVGEFTVSDILKHVISNALLNEGYDVEMEAITPHAPWGFIQIKFKVFQTYK